MPFQITKCGKLTALFANGYSVNQKSDIVKINDLIKATNAAITYI